MADIARVPIEHTPRRAVMPSPVRLRSIPRTPTKRKSSANVGPDSPRKCLFQEHRVLDPDNEHFPLFDLGFSLVRDSRAICPTRDQWILLETAFPTSTSIGVLSGMLTVQYESLPPKPWPVVMAGLPVYITTEEFAWPLRPQRYGGPKRIMSAHDARSGPSAEVFQLAIDYFEKELNVAIVCILNLLGQWIITIPEDATLSDLPCMIAKSPCSYLYTSEVPEPREAALSSTRPFGTTWDSSPYTPLRPGIMTSSGKIPGCDDELLTTCGVQVIDNDNNKFLTVATHGFPNGREIVYHPTMVGGPIGDVVRRIPDAGISICKLRPGLPFENETFAGDVLGDTVEGIVIKGIRRTDEMKFYDMVSMNNPFSGYHDGVFVGTQLKRVPIDEATVNREWVRDTWVWLGMGMEPLNGSCGSAILDEDGNVVSFFRFLVDEYPGCGIGVAATTLSDFGYRIA